MAKRYLRLGGNVNIDTSSGECKVCRKPLGKYQGSVLLDLQARDFGLQKKVLACSQECISVLEAAEYVRTSVEVVYRIHSGWPNNPVWDCPVELHPFNYVSHLHTTRASRAAPSIFSGKVSGLFFSAHGSSFPVESREGKLMLITYINDQRQEQEIGVGGAIKNLIALKITLAGFKLVDKFLP